jgi:hypothetical protein
MPSGTGLGATWGIGREATVGTAVAPSRWFEFTSEGFELSREAVQGQGIRGAGSQANRGSRRVVTAVGVTGSIAGELPTHGLGLLLQAMTGATPIITQQGTTTAYEHAYKAGDLDGKSYTVQVKRPDATGAANIFTYRGCKVTGWEIACSAGEIATISADFDGWNEDTAQAYTAAAYPAGASIFSFKDGALYTGGTVATATNGVLTHTGGTLVSSVTGATVSGSNTLKTDRRFFGNQGVKAEQVENGVREVTGSLEAEYTGNALYNQYVTDTPLVLRLTFTSALLAGVGFPYLFEVLLPQVFLNGETPKVAGTDVLTQTIGFDSFEDTARNPVAQIRLVTTDTAP